MTGFVLSKNVAVNEFKRFIEEFNLKEFVGYNNWDYESTMVIYVHENIVFMGKRDPRLFIVFNNGILNSMSIKAPSANIRLNDEMSIWLVEAMAFAATIWHNDTMDKIKKMDSISGNTALNRFIDLVCYKEMSGSYMKHLVESGFMLNNMYFYKNIDEQDRGIWFANRFENANWSIEQILVEQP